MFERRVKIFMMILVVFTLVLLARAMQLQVVEHQEWSEMGDRINTRPELIETTRGRILDRNDRVIATNSPCIDACVDFRAIIKDQTWISKLAKSRLLASPDGQFLRADAKGRERLLADEVQEVRDDIERMWDRLAILGSMSREQIDDICQSIILRVQMRQRYVWYYKYEKAVQDHGKSEPPPWYRRWLVGGGDDGLDVDAFFFEVAERTQSHVILPAIRNDTNNFLGKNLDSFPGLKLRPSIRRYYPFHTVGAHFMGQLSYVTKADLKQKAEDSEKNKDDRTKDDELQGYLPNDVVGRGGLEGLLEPLLRGKRGRVERNLLQEDRITQKIDPVPGQDVRTTIDMELQADVLEAFKHVKLDHQPEWTDVLPMPGAAVVIDVPSGDVLAMASYPSFDANAFDEDYQTLVMDDINRPLLNRATQFALEPGSTVKPIVGIGAITQGLLPPDGTIECTGYLTLNGRVYKNQARCWVATMFAKQLQGMGMTPAHHPVPTNAPHPNGFLTFPDALERSCNVFFETLADRMGIAGLNHWFTQFGLGESTGVGIAEVKGSIPRLGTVPMSWQPSTTWFAGIGQGQVRATPIQMANVAATIARDGVWIRPHLVPLGTKTSSRPTTRPDRVDLMIDPMAMKRAKEGMIAVVNGSAGTGTQVRRTDMIVAGKTGTAQAAKFTVPLRDDNGRIIYKKVAQLVDGEAKSVDSKIPQTDPLDPGTHANPHPQAPWYRGGGEKEDKLAHAWFIGFAPANDPKIAFAVFVEYGAAGGAVAGSVADQLLDACVKRGYFAK